MASGKLLVLFGQECKRQRSYTGLDKEYEIEVVCGIDTDTGDALGLPHYSPTETSVHSLSLKHALKRVAGTHSVPYPAFSSKTVAGKPLFTYALSGTMDTITVPKHDETVYRIRVSKISRLSIRMLEQRIIATLKTVPRSNEPSKVLGADFRQDQIREAWRRLFLVLPTQELLVLSLRVTSGPGTYMRTLASRIAKELGTDGFALSIARTRIGSYVPLGPFGFWKKEY